MSRGTRPTPSLALLAAVFLFIFLATIAFFDSGPPNTFDASLHLWVMVHRSSSLLHIARIVTWLGASIVAVPLTLAGSLLVAQETLRHCCVEP